MERKSKGFTLIELLAVIVILGLLMAIAIPSVTKYITQSRKKTVTTTIGNYIGALTNQVNDMEYIFTKTNTIYAVPIECIALERGGTDPFGKWYQASNSYWAYVLVQYDDKTSSYTYGFTFKDSAGYGLYPTTSEKLKESGSQILTDLDLTRPITGPLENLTPRSNWIGFSIDDETTLVVFESAKEGETGDGVETCTLCQKGDNYQQAEEEKKAYRKPCQIISGSGLAVGTQIACGAEKFHIVSKTSTTVTMFTDNLIKDDFTQKTAADNWDNISSLNIGNSAYWLNGSSLKSKYGTSYPAYVYDSNSPVYPLLQGYQNYLISTLGVSNAVVEMTNVNQYLSLGCTKSSDKVNCNSAPSWINSTGTGFILGSMYSSNKVYFMFGKTISTYVYSDISSGTRASVTIPIDQIKQ